MKKILCFLMCICFLSAWGCDVQYAAAENAGAAGWVPQTAGAMYDSGNDCLSLGFEAASGEEGYEAAARTVQADDGIFAMTFVMSFEDVYSGGSVSDESHSKGISLRNPQSPENAVDIIRLGGKTVSIFGEVPAEAAELAASTLYRVTAAIDFAGERAAVWINGKAMFGGSINGSADILNNGAAELYAWNSFYQRRRGVVSEFKIQEMFLGGGSRGIAEVSPADGSVITGGEKTPISLSWGGLLGGAANQSGLTAADKESFSLKQGEKEKEFSVRYLGETVEIIPENNLEYDREYRLTSVKFRDIFDTKDIEEVNISFKTAPEGYAPPKLSVEAYRNGTAITDEAVRIYTGEQLLFKCRVESDTEIENVVFACGGKRGEADCKDNGVYEYAFTADTAGSFELTANAYDTLGGASEPYKINIHVAENAAPSVSFKSLSDECEISAAELSRVEIEARDEDGSIDRIELYIDGKLHSVLTEAPYYADFSSAAKSRHIFSAVAYDNFGASAEAAVSVIVTGDTQRSVIFEEGFEYYSGGLPDGMTGTVGSRRDGEPILRASADYGENNTVCEWFVDSETSENVPNTWIGYDLPNGNAVVTYEYDIKYKAFPQKLYTYLIQQYYEGSSKKNVNLTDFTVERDKLSIYNRAFPIRLETDCLYRIVYTVDAENSRVRASVFDYGSSSFLLETPYVSMRNTVRANTAINLRMTAYYDAGTEARFAMDNIAVAKTLTQPVIKSIGFDENESPALIPPETESIKVFLTAAADISAGNVRVCSNGRELALKSAEYDGAAVITFAEKLKPNTVYTVEISVPWYGSGGEPITEVIACDFKTDYAIIDAADIRLEKSADGCKIKGRLIDKNNSGGEVYSIVTVYSGKKIEKIAVKKLELRNNAEFETEKFSAEAAQTIDFALWKSLTAPQLIASSVLQ